MPDILKHSKSNSKYTNTLSIVPTLQEVKDYVALNNLKTILKSFMNIMTVLIGKTGMAGE